MNTWKVILATVVIFIAGAFAGGLLVGYSHLPKPTETVKVGGSAGTPHGTTNSTRELKLPAPLMGPLRKDFVDRLQKELQMSADQRERIEKIIREGQEITRAIWVEVEPDIFHTMVDTKDRIRAELTPEQLVKFEQLLKPKSKNPTIATNATPALLTNSVHSKP